jgi:hypothetical protein
MTNLQKRLLLFLIGCIGTRALFVVIAKNLQGDYLRYAGYLALLPAIGFMYIFLTGARQTGPETLGAPIWWNNLRPVHAALYFLFAYNAIRGISSAWIYLLIDVVFGFFNFAAHHYVNGDFATALRDH